MDDEAKQQVDELRALLEGQIDRTLGPQWGCWPLLVALGGLLLGLALLAGGP